MSDYLAKVGQGRPALNMLSDEEELFRSSVRSFALDKVKPNTRRMDEESKFSRDLISEFFKLGLMAVEVPEEYGGAGGSFFQTILAIEELSAVDPAAAVVVDVQNTLVVNAILRWANEEQKKLHLPRLSADTVGAYALSEAGSGSDAFAMATRAQDRGDYFVLNGRKLWITNAQEAGLFLLFANVRPEAGYRGVTAFLIDLNTPGFKVGRKEEKLGIRASSTCELILEDCSVPRQNVIGEVGKGYTIAIETLNEGRIGIGAQMCGLARGALDHAIRYANERKQFGRPIGEFQAIQFQLAKMAVEVEAARNMTYNAARLKDAGMPFVKEAAMTKYFASQIAERVASMAIEIFGGYGFTKDYPVEKYWRDSKIGKIYEGTSNMQLQTIAKCILQK
jgi:alkylation response protein AidB-like acyl-CoA dehydrogenase